MLGECHLRLLLRFHVPALLYLSLIAVCLRQFGEVPDMSVGTALLGLMSAVHTLLSMATFLMMNAAFIHLILYVVVIRQQRHVVNTFSRFMHNWNLATAVVLLLSSLMQYLLPTLVRCCSACCAVMCLCTRESLSRAHYIQDGAFSCAWLSQGLKLHYVYEDFLQFAVNIA